MNTAYMVADCTTRRTAISLLTEPVKLEIITALRYDELSIEELSEVLRLSKTHSTKHVIELMQAKLLKKVGSGAEQKYAVTSTRLADMCAVLFTLWLQERV